MLQNRPKCLSCSSSLISWGKTSLGKKRYRCVSCSKTRLYQKQNKKDNQLFGLFKQYVLWGNTYGMLSSLSGYSIAHLIEKFHEFLEQDPPKLPLLNQTGTEEAFLLIDGLWLRRGFVLMAYRQSKNLMILHISVVGREAATKIAKDLKNLVSFGYRFTGVVSDGGTGIIKAVNIVFPHIVHQICLAHLHRDIIGAIGRYPKGEKVRELKRIADHIWLIESKEALKWWVQELQIWISKYNSYLKEKRYDIDYNW